MTCDVVQKRLLACDRPDLPPVDLKGHLVACPVCRAWHRRLVRLEQQIPTLPVPPSQTRQAFLQRLITEPVRPESPAPVMPQLVRFTPPGPSRKERGLQKMAVAFALAAAMLLFAVGWWVWQRPAAARIGSTEAARALDRDLNDRLNDRLARSGTPQLGVKNMAELAEELRQEVVDRVEDAEQLAILARFYAEVVRTHLLRYANELPDPHRPQLLDIARRFDQTESDFGRLAAAAKDGCAESLRTIAMTAHEVAHELRQLV
jgi:hypothetical protein